MAGLIDHPYTLLGELIGLAGAKREQSQNPFYNTIVSMRPVDADHFHMADRPVRPEPVASGSAKLELNLEIYHSQGRYCFRLEYASSLFAEDTVSLYTRSLETIIAQTLLTPMRRSSGSSTRYPTMTVIISSSCPRPSGFPFPIFRIRPNGSTPWPKYIPMRRPSYFTIKRPPSGKSSAVRTPWRAYCSARGFARGTPSAFFAAAVRS